MKFEVRRSARVPAEVHVFRSGRDGQGEGKSGSDVTPWPTMRANRGK
jgi:hypothetical protein